MEPPKFAIIGTGFIFPRHASSIIDIGGEIVDVVNDSHSPDAWKEMIEKTSADYISICTPNDLHFEMAKAASLAGKKVLCEKPLTIDSKLVRELANLKNIFTVLQLRHHPMVRELKANIEKDRHYEVEMDISVYRDQHYFDIWKGQTNRSGGVLYNLGVHYFDLMIHLFGEPTQTSTTFIDEKTGEGTMTNERFSCKWRVSVGERRDNQRRVFRIEGKDYNFSSKDNLSYEDLHKFVYQDLLQDKGVTPQEQIVVTDLIAKLSQKH